MKKPLKHLIIERHFLNENMLNNSIIIKYKLKVCDNVKLMSTNGFKPKTNKKIKVEKKLILVSANKIETNYMIL